MNPTFKLTALTLLLLCGCSAKQSAPELSLEETSPVQPSVMQQPEPLQPAERKVASAAASEQVQVADKMKQELAEQTSANVAVGLAYPAAPAMDAMIHPPHSYESRENYATLSENGLQSTQDQPISTFSIDVDTAAYANVRRFINHGQLPPVAAVRIEEMLNYFDYQYPAPNTPQTPFRVSSEIGPTPWSTNSQLIRIGIKGFDPAQEQRLPRNLVFLLDVSGSMNQPNKLPLVKQSFRLLVNQLNAQDTVSIVVYAGASGVVLPPTAGNQTDTILNALDRLSAGGSTNGGEGIERAYELAQQRFIKHGVNRVILATDGDFNVGLSGTDELIRLIKQKKQSGVGLTVLGVGMGNYNDHMLEQISDSGDGNAAYIDTLQEAKKVLVTDINSTLQTIARDTKIQVEFNPEVVSSYRLIGYENRMLKQQDFTNDRVDAGDIGAGHTVTALYEIHLAQPSRYKKAASSDSNELGFLKIRYKQPDGERSIELSHPLLKSEIKTSLAQTSTDYRFAAAVAGFGQLLRNSKQLGDFGYHEVLKLANGSLGADPYGYRSEFVRLVDSAKSLN